MKALAVRQPHAWLIVHGYKDVEYRPWLTHYRGRFFVHANKAIDEAEVEQVRLQKAQDGINLPDELPGGGIVGVVMLVDCIRVGDVSRPWRFLGRLRGQQSPCGDQRNKICYGFILEDPRPLSFVPYRGQQKFFNVPDHLFRPEIDF